MDPVTLGLLASTAIGSIYSGSQQRSAANKNLDFQKWLANEELKMGRASRTDAMGNTVRYDPVTNAWTTDLSPAQRMLSKAGEHEQQLSLTEDAARNRQLRERAFQRGMGASDTYNDLNAQYRYGYNPSEGSIEDQIAGLMLRGRTQGGGGVDTTRQFIRQRGNLPVVSSSAGGSGNAVSSIADALLQARQGALGERGQRSQQRAQLLPQMQSAAAMSDAGGGAPVNFPDFGDLFKSQAGQSKEALGALEAGGKGVQGGYNAQIKALGGQYPSIGDSAKLITAMRGGKQPIDWSDIFGSKSPNNTNNYGSDYADF